jgi:hypothetical protein
MNGRLLKPFLCEASFSGRLACKQDAKQQHMKKKKASEISHGTKFGQLCNLE